MIRDAKNPNSEPIEAATYERLYVLLEARYPGKVWRVVEVQPASVVKTIDNEADAKATIAKLELAAEGKL